MFDHYNDAKLEELTQEIEATLPPRIDTSQLQPLSKEELLRVLGITIKHDNTNKLITFLCCVSTFTDSSQFNVSFNAPSSSGKSYIPIELSNLFPDEDVMRIGNCSPTAFFHEQGAYDKELNIITVDLSRKLIIFIEMPNNGLLERLRPLLSHDMKEIVSKITDKNQKGGNRTKTVVIKGYPAVIFCTAGLSIDEQELTRFILLSPEINQEKIRESIHERILRESNSAAYSQRLEDNPDRQLLMERIIAIRNEEIRSINIASPELIEEQFQAKHSLLKPKHMRDIGKIMNIAKALALLNLWWRDRDGDTITASDEDIVNALDIWGQISMSQELGIPPYIYNFYYEIVLSAWKEKLSDIETYAPKPKGLTRQEIRNQHYKLRESNLNDFKLRAEILPMLETAGLILQENALEDARQKLVVPLADVNVNLPPINSEHGGGVTQTNELLDAALELFESTNSDYEAV